MATAAVEKSKRDPTEELHEWIATIPCLKSRKNLTRDFSDAVLMAELLKIYYPRYVELHNYAPANSVNTKRENWSLLNRKVLARIDMRLTKEAINQLANSYPGAVEKLLSELRNRVSKGPGESCTNSCADRDDKLSVEGDGEQRDLDTENEGNNSVITDNTDNNVFPPSKHKGSAFSRVKRRLMVISKWLIGWICVWNYVFKIFTGLSFARPVKNVQNDAGDFSSNEGLAGSSTATEDSIPCHLYAKLKQELREKDDTISTLNHKVTYLESAMKLKDLRISNLTSQILQNAVESEKLQSNAIIAQSRQTTDRKTLAN